MWSKEVHASEREARADKPLHNKTRYRELPPTSHPPPPPPENGWQVAGDARGIEEAILLRERAAKIAARRRRAAFAAKRPSVQVSTFGVRLNPRTDDIILLNNFAESLEFFCDLKIVFDLQH